MGAAKCHAGLVQIDHATRRSACREASVSLDRESDRGRNAFLTSMAARAGKRPYMATPAGNKVPPWRYFGMSRERPIETPHRPKKVLSGREGEGRRYRSSHSSKKSDLLGR